MIRNGLRAGRFRHIAALVAAVVGGYALFRTWPLLVFATARPHELLPKLGFVAAAFSVTAYNLRTRVVDLVLKHESDPSRVADLADIARSCGMRLTNLVLLFTITALCLCVVGVIPETSRFARLASCTIGALLCFSIVHFIYILFAFERLEDFVLREAQNKAQDSEAKRLGGQG